MYTELNPNMVTVFYDDTDVDSSTQVIHASFKRFEQEIQTHGWDNVENMGLTFWGTSYNVGNPIDTYDGKIGYVARFWDDEKLLLGCHLKLYYIP